MRLAVGAPAAGTLAAIRRAFERLNPCGDLDVDLLAISRAAAISSTADWSAQALSNVTADPITGAVTLAKSAASTIFSQTTGSSQWHSFHDAQDGVEEYALDFFPDPNAFNGVPFTLDSIDLYLKLGTFIGKAQYFRVTVGVYDARWRLVPLGDPIDISTRDILAQNGAVLTGGLYTLRFLQDFNRRFVFEPGTLTTRTGAGRDSSGLIRAVAVDSTGASTLVMARGLSISIQPTGPGFAAAQIGACPSATLAGFNPGAFWRYAPNRSMGPYDPDVAGYAASDVNHNPDDHLVTGAVPGYGAIAGTSGQWGIARRIPTAQRAQDASNGWHQPYHNLRAVAYQASGSVVATLDLGAVPVNPVQIRLDDVQPAGTSIVYTIAGSNTGAAGSWIALGTVTDGQELTNASGTYLYRYYQLTATLSAGGGATKYATPALLAWQMVERVTLATWRYLEDFDADASIEPVTGQSSVAELKLPVLRAGVRNFRDLATLANSQYAPSSIEAHVFARDVVSRKRYFLNSYRLENRNPTDGAEEMTFTGGLDLLSGLLPPAVESYRYPASGQATITSVTGAAPNITIGVSGGTPFATQDVSGMRFHGVTGTAAKLDYPIQSTASPSSFVINTTVGGAGQYGATPAVGDTFEIHSDKTTRGPLTYSGQDFAAIAADLLNVQSGVASRYRGQLPATTGRLSGTYTLPGDGVKALDVLSHVGLHCGGGWQWMRGRISFVDLYGKKDSVLTLDEHHYVNLETPLGADRRMPTVKSRYNYQSDTGSFANETQTDDADALAGWGRPNLFDVYEIPDDVDKWNDGNGAESAYLTAMLQGAWKTGVRLWTVDTVFQYPWLDFGDAITIVTDQYTDRRLAYAADGVTDIGAPIAGRIAAVGVLVGKNLWGDKLVVAIRGLDAITALASNASGTVAGTTSVPDIPTPTATFDTNGQALINVAGDTATASIKYVVRTDRLPTAAEVRAAAAESGSTLANVASGVTVAAGGIVFVGALAYNAVGDESPLGTTAAVRGSYIAPQVVLQTDQASRAQTAVTLTMKGDSLPTPYTWNLYKATRGSANSYGNIFVDPQGAAIASGTDTTKPFTQTFGVTADPVNVDSYLLIVNLPGGKVAMATTTVQPSLPHLSVSGGGTVVDLVRQDGSGAIPITTLAGGLGKRAAALDADNFELGSALGMAQGWTYVNGVNLQRSALYADQGTSSGIHNHGGAASNSRSDRALGTLYAGLVYTATIKVRHNLGNTATAAVLRVMPASGLASDVTVLARRGNDYSSTYGVPTDTGSGALNADTGVFITLSVTFLVNTTQAFTLSLITGYFGTTTGFAAWDSYELDGEATDPFVGGYRGKQAINSGFRINGPQNIPMCRVANAGGIATVNPISGATWDSTAGQWRANINAHTFYRGDGTYVSVNAGSVLLPIVNTTYFIYADDPAQQGGALTYQASSLMSDAVGSADRRFIGSIASGGAGGGGTPGTPQPGGSSGGACFVAGTLVSMADGRDRAIETIRPGDFVLAFDGLARCLVPARVLATHVHEVDDLVVVATDRARVATTAEHPFLVPGGLWDPAGDLTAGDLVFERALGGELRATHVRSVERVRRPGPVYNLTVERWHTYVAGGFAVHNTKLV